MSSTILENKTAEEDSSSRLQTHQQPFLIIRPTRGLMKINVREIWQYRDLLSALASRDIKVRYKQTALGVVWVILQPLLAAGIFSFVFGKIAKMPTDGVPAFIFSYAGLTGWGLCSNVLTRVSNCLVGNSHLIAKVFFPRLVLPLSTLGSVVVDFVVAFGLMLALLFLNGIPLHASLLTLPFWIMLSIALSLGVGLWAAALTVSYRDVQYVLPVFVQLAMYATPVAYSVIAVPVKYRTIYYMNPLAGLTEGFRWSILGTTHTPEIWAIAWSAIASIGALLIGLIMFKAMERKFADVI